jgi:microcin C transport system permease protein
LPRRCARARRFDAITTFGCWLGYAIPGFVLGMLLIVLFAGGTFYDWFPLRGLTSDNWEELSAGKRASRTTSGT